MTLTAFNIKKALSYDQRYKTKYKITSSYNRKQASVDHGHISTTLTKDI